MSTTQTVGLAVHGGKTAIADSGMNQGIDAAPHRVVRLHAVCCLALIPWTIGLALTLPRSYLVANWPLAWTGFDVILLSCLATTAWALHKQRHVAVPASITTSVLLFCDAWFDILTAHGGLCRTVSVVTAVLAEIPLALMLSVIAGRLLRASASAAVTDAACSSIWRTPLPGSGAASPSDMRRPSDVCRSRARIQRAHHVVSVTSVATNRTREMGKTLDSRTHGFDQPGRPHCANRGGAAVLLQVRPNQRRSSMPPGCDDIRLSLGAYLLGALSRADRALADAHLRTCATCRAEVCSMSSLPGLLSRVPKTDISRLADPSPKLLERAPSVVAEQRQHNRRLRMAALFHRGR
jgi:predicted anti-sigma-YlaC factor YlaD